MPQQQWGQPPQNTTALAKPVEQNSTVSLIDLKSKEAELRGIKSQTKIAKQKAEIAKLKAEKALLKSNMMEEMHGTKDEAKIAKINALSAEVFEDTKDVKRIQKGLSQVKSLDSDDEDDSATDMKSNKKKALALEKKQEKDNKKKAIELEKEEEKQDKENKKKVVELEKAEEGETDTDEAGSSGRITKILKMLEEEIVARSSKDSDPPAVPEMPEKPCKDGMSELKKYFSGKEGVKRSAVFIKFAKLLTGGDDGAPESTAQVPQLAAAVSKPK